MKMGSDAVTVPGKGVWGLPLLRYGAFLVVLAVILILPSFASPYVISMIIKILIYGIFALSLNLLFGYAGLFSLGHAAFFGAGSYAAAIMLQRTDISSFWLVILGGILAAAVCAALFGFIALKVSGVYFLMVTFAIGQLLYSVAIKWRDVTGGSNGLVGIPLPDLSIPWIKMTSVSFYYLVLVGFAVCLFVLLRVAKSPFGVTLMGIRGDELRMQALGYNTWLYKYIAFIIGGLFAGLAGVLLVYHDGFVGPGHLGFETSATVMLMVILGSDRVFWGPVLGAVLIILLEYFASLYTPDRWPLILGAVFVLSVMFLRGGVGVHLVRLWNKGRKRYGIT